MTIRKGLAVPVIMNVDDPWPPRFTKQPEIGSKINGYVLLDCFGDAAFPCFVVSPGDNLMSQKHPLFDEFRDDEQGHCGFAKPPKARSQNPFSRS